MNIDVFLKCVTLMFAAMSFLLLFRSQRAKLIVKSWLGNDGGRLVIKTVCRNETQRAVTIDSIRAPLTIWGTLPYNYSNVVSRSVAVCQEFFDPTITYVSDLVIEYDEGATKGERTISNGQNITAIVDIENMIDVFDRSGETLRYHVVTLFFLMTFHMQIYLANGKVVTARLGIKDRLQLLSLYWNDARFFK